MRGGGQVDGDLWTTKVRLLRPGDHFRAGNWEDVNELWSGGDVCVLKEIENDHDKRYLILKTHYRDCPTQDRVFCILKEDTVTLAARELPGKPPKKDKVVRGVQLSLF